MRERDVERHLVARVKALGGEVRKLKWVGRRGAPDRVVMLPPSADRFVEVHSPDISTKIRWMPTILWVELKRPGGEAEAHQAREHARMLKMGQRVLVLDTVEKIDEVLG